MAFACFKVIVKFPEAAGDVFLDMLTRGTFLKMSLEWQSHAIHSQVCYYHATEDKLSHWLAKWTLIHASTAEVVPGNQCTHVAKTHRPLAPQPTVLRGHLVMMLTWSERLVTGGPKQDKTSTDVSKDVSEDQHDCRHEEQMYVAHYRTNTSALVPVTSSS